ncbi:dTDP-4-dehydrorhamnose reductase [Marinomonas shanghaiensis]|uniref:dTDP-4-dehydrorhamnose reductase n=1 Tax=Marinomonas shanghaiensis TaxID=2202418 RepID=UPI003A943120
MKIIVIGSTGQLGWELQQAQSAIEQTLGVTFHTIYLSSSQLDITDGVKVTTAIKLHHPDIVINAAAYTAVDKAESDEAKAYSVNALGVKNLAVACHQCSAKLIHVSTDFVFDGSKNTPYLSSDSTNPVSVYGASKLAGEQHVQAILANQACIVRTAWVYSEHGNNFVKTMLRLMAEKDQLGVVYDQVGTPTWAKGLAKMIWTLAVRMHNENSSQYSPLESVSQTPIHHWTDAGVASWYDFAVAIQDIAFEKGLLDKRIPVRPIPTSAYTTAAKRPSYSVLDKASAEQASGRITQHWRASLEEMLGNL